MGAAPAPLPPPSGSVAEDYSYSISDENLNLLSNTTKSSLLSVSNLGASITSRINSTLDLIDAFGSQEAYLLDATSLNSLLDGGTSAVFAAPNVGSSTHVKIIIILGPIAPTNPAPKIAIYSGATGYTLELSSVDSPKRLEFNNISEAFANSFTLTNNTGVAFASYGNSVVVVPL